jgi:hypothetical protein
MAPAPAAPPLWQRLVAWIAANPRVAAILLLIGALPWASMCLFCLIVMARATVIPCGR